MKLATTLKNGDQLLGIAYHFKIFRSQVATRKKKLIFRPVCTVINHSKLCFNRAHKLEDLTKKKIVANYKISFLFQRKKKKKIGVTAVHVHALKYLIVIPVFNKFLSKYFTIGQDFVNFRN